MTHCPDYETMLWADIHGELDETDRKVWESHLSECDACRAEKKDALRWVGSIREAMTLPQVSGENLDAAIARIENQTARKKSHIKKQKRFASRPFLWIPVAATACVMLISMVLFNMNSKELAQEDMEVISNLDLLTDFDAIEKIVKVVDHPDADTDSDPESENSSDDSTQEMGFDERDSIYG